MAADVRMVNDQGGINGCKIDFIAHDDDHIPAKTVEATRRLSNLTGCCRCRAGSARPPTSRCGPILVSVHHVPQLFITKGSNRPSNREK
jgi:branched-chain amino acid transport system substrate-binding protein